MDAPNATSVNTRKHGKAESTKETLPLSVNRQHSKILSKIKNLACDYDSDNEATTTTNVTMSDSDNKSLSDDGLACIGLKLYSSRKEGKQHGQLGIIDDLKLLIYLKSSMHQI